ncbi:DUF1894 domain-containing protein [Methanolobus mangrovi]|uniref:DUF1894 domain-containing protein n=1 Tax=Methanolobus mangrovi TaxID=3072977 RepID=A0AA51UF78_9EURY|nr:DUF1894 domain-containing protein [Methanolobus mangrovi]WMW22063.1 DUF1894 domain-containing protein [Methanolobus mangrovi]
MACINDIPFEILIKGATPAQCEKLIQERSDKVYHVTGGYRIRGVALMGDNVPVGVKGDEVFFQFIKPCFGLFVLRVPDATDIAEQLEKDFKK